VARINPAVSVCLYHAWPGLTQLYVCVCIVPWPGLTQLYLCVCIMRGLD
jgi:hypothetical protein